MVSYSPTEKKREWTYHDAFFFSNPGWGCENMWLLEKLQRRSPARCVRLVYQFSWPEFTIHKYLVSVLTAGAIHSCGQEKKTVQLHTDGMHELEQQLPSTYLRWFNNILSYWQKVVQRCFYIFFLGQWNKKRNEIWIKCESFSFLPLNGCYFEKTGRIIIRWDFKIRK